MDGYKWIMTYPFGWFGYSQKWWCLLHRPAQLKASRWPAIYQIYKPKKYTKIRVISHRPTRNTHWNHHNSAMLSGQLSHYCFFRLPVEKVRFAVKFSNEVEWRTTAAIIKLIDWSVVREITGTILYMVDIEKSLATDHYFALSNI